MNKGHAFVLKTASGFRWMWNTNWSCYLALFDLNIFFIKHFLYGLKLKEKKNLRFNPQIIGNAQKLNPSNDTTCKSADKQYNYDVFLIWINVCDASTSMVFTGCFRCCGFNLRYQRYTFTCTHGYMAQTLTMFFCHCFHGIDLICPFCHLPVYIYDNADFP